ncbi:MAG: sensor histidine kinase, partial [[Ruminococcus] torques]
TYTDLLKNEKDEEKRKEYISVLERKSLRLKVLIEDLFEISKAASKSVVMHFMKVDIVGLFKQVELENVEKIKAANLEFRTKIPEQKVVMWLDSEKTYRIFENLIVNITKYAMPHTRVYIDMTETEDGVHITMKNVSAAELNFNADEITDRFVRGDSARNTEGSGLGLAIAKSFAELQHGSLKISTEADLFKADLYLPKSKEMPEKPGGGVS